MGNEKRRKITRCDKFIVLKGLKFRKWLGNTDKVKIHIWPGYLNVYSQWKSLENCMKFFFLFFFISFFFYWKKYVFLFHVFWFLFSLPQTLPVPLNLSSPLDPNPFSFSLEIQAGIRDFSTQTWSCYLSATNCFFLQSCASNFKQDNVPTIKKQECVLSSSHLSPC